MRRGITELNGEGEVAGGIIVMRYGENALATIEAVKQKLDSLRKSLPEGVEIVTTYDRSESSSARSATSVARSSRNSSSSHWCAWRSCSTYARRWSPS